MKYGAREGNMNFLRRLVAKAIARQIRIFPVPGADILRISQSSSAKESYELASNPREANVLLVMGDLPRELAERAAVVYAQIPRPRVLVFAGVEKISVLPEPDVQVSWNENFLDEALPQVKELFQEHAWSENVESWKPDFLVSLFGDSDDEEEHGHQHHGHNHGDEEENHDHSDHKDNGGHDHGDMDFMSMVEMTKDLPRPKDGLPMNRSEAYFGPFHPGLPGGLSVFTELDGDTVMKARVEHERIAKSVEEFLPIQARKLPDLLGDLNPLASESYRLLGRKALQNASNNGEAVPFTENQLLLLESERVASHLNWLATFGKTIGNNWLYRGATYWHSRQKEGQIEFEAIHPFLEKMRDMLYLEKKLTIGEGIPNRLLHHISGPVARAAGQEKDTRLNDDLYQALSWKPIVKNEDNAWGRLLVRLNEIEQSLHLIDKVEGKLQEEKDYDFTGSGITTAEIESPRGKLALYTKVKGGEVYEMEIQNPSTMLAGLVSAVIKEIELSDALLEIASFDISPWEIQPKREGE